MSRTMARFSSRVVRRARSTWRTSDLATRQTDRGLRVEQRPHLRVGVGAATPALRVAPNATSTAWRRSSSVRARRKNSVSLGMAPGPAALDEADAELVEQPRDGELVDHRVGDALALGAVAQRRVEDLVRHRRAPSSVAATAAQQKDPSRMREVCALTAGRLRASAIMSRLRAGHVGYLPPPSPPWSPVSQILVRELVTLYRGRRPAGKPRRQSERSTTAGIAVDTLDPTRPTR